MKSWNLVILGLVIVMAATSGMAGEITQREEPAVIVKILDLLIVRPVSAAVATVSTGVCAVAAPFTYIAGVPEASVRVLVEAPWRFTGGRPLGDFSGNYKDGKPITVVHDQ